MDISTGFLHKRTYVHLDGWIRGKKRKGGWMILSRYE